MEWTQQQAKALEDIGNWLRDPGAQQVYRFFGFAGTGKTTLAKHIGESQRTLFLAYTGKAASVLRKKGIPEARTIHSALYGVGEADTTRLIELIEALEAPRNDAHRANLEAQLQTERERVKRPRFWLNEDSIINHYDLIFVDECSMVNDRIAGDLESFGKKILVSGDPFQLPPVRGSGTYMRDRADTMLTDIRRQELDNPIIRWSMMLRDRQLIPYGASDCGKARKLLKKNVDDEFLAHAGQLLTGKNETRRALNTAMRKYHGINVKKNPWPLQDEPVILLRNDTRFGVLNGVIATMNQDARPAENNTTLFANMLYEGQNIEVILDQSQFMAYNKDIDPRLCEIDMTDRTRVAADFGYAVTVHKSQGSQWNHVCLVDDGFAKRTPEDRFRWQYTAVTRAEEQVVIVA